jgi:hypothetical protein
MKSAWVDHSRIGRIFGKGNCGDLMRFRQGANAGGGAGDQGRLSVFDHCAALAEIRIACVTAPRSIMWDLELQTDVPT